jgi:dynein heavy chain
MEEDQTTLDAIADATSAEALNLEDQDKDDANLEAKEQTAVAAEPVPEAAPAPVPVETTPAPALVAQPQLPTEPEYHPPVDRFKKSLALARFKPELWSDEHDIATEEYLSSTSVRKLFVWVDASDALVMQQKLPQAAVDEVMYFIRDSNDLKPRIEDEEFERRVQFGAITGSTLDSLLRLMQGVYMPLFLDNRAWPDNVRKEFANQLHKFMAFLTDTTFQQQGHTVLYVPNEHITSTAEAARSKDLVQRLEALLVHWTRQIKEVVNNQHTSEAADNSGPLEEVQFWRSRCDDLSGISKQLNRDDVKQIIEVLTISKSTYLEQFLRLANM